MQREYWARPLDTSVRPFDTGYCTSSRPSFGPGGAPPDEELIKRGFVKMVERSSLDDVLKALEFYGDPANWTTRSGKIGITPVWSDLGNSARATLARYGIGIGVKE